MPIKIGAKILNQFNHHSVINGEETLAAAAVQPPGAALYNMYKNKNAAGMVGGGLSMAFSKLSKGTEGIAATIPGQMGGLVLTPTRLLFVSFSRLSGRPKKLLAEWPRDSVQFSYNASNEYPELLASFSDGSGAIVYAERAGGLDMFAAFTTDAPGG